jgi:hypothetical protein
MLLIYLIISAGGVIGIALLLTLFTYPELYTRFGKFLVRSIRHAAGRPSLTPEQEEAKAKAKKLAPYMALASRIEQLIPRQTLRFKIPETWGGNFITVELNPQYPQTGRKYILSIEKAVNGMPGEKRTIMYVSDQPVEIAASIMERNGELFVAAGETPVSTEKVAVDAKKEAGSTGKESTVI